MYEPPPKRAVGRMVARLVAGCVLIIALTAVAASTTVFEAVGLVADAFKNGAPISSHDLTAAGAGQPQTILLLGSDHRYDPADIGNAAHSDTIMLIRLDPKLGQTTVMSIPRDLMVSFEHNGGYYQDVKINQAFSNGGPDLSLSVVRHLLGIPINDIVVLNFETFATVVDDLGCVYIDVDHHFYIPPDTGVASIDIHPGYQPLCYFTALSYARFRHYDSTFARDAREQDFLRQAKQQLGVSGLLSNYQGILNTIGQAVQTNIRGTNAVLRLLLIAQSSVSGPVRQVPFAAEPVTGPGGAADETASPEQIQQAVKNFLYGSQPAVLPSSTASSGATHTNSHHGSHRTHAAAPSAPGLIDASSQVKQSALQLQVNTPIPVYAPTLVSVDGSQPDSSDYYSFTERVQAHAAHAGLVYHDYRITWALGATNGAYYGMEGMDWTSPPLFAYADHGVFGGHHYEYVLDGSTIRDIGWIQGKDLYWVSNSIFDTLTNDQMIALAESAEPVTGTHHPLN